MIIYRISFDLSSFSLPQPIHIFNKIFFVIILLIQIHSCWSHLEGQGNKMSFQIMQLSPFVFRLYILFP